LTSPTTTEAPSIVTVDPGQVIRINARFPGDPSSVRFSFLSPQSKQATHDPGAHEVDSKIENSGDLYYYSIDTRGMRGGLGWWYFVSDDEDPSKRRAKVGRFIVRDVPMELIAKGEVVVGAGETSASKMLWPWIVGSGAAGLLVGTLAARRPDPAGDGTEEVEEPAALGLPLPMRSVDGKFLSAATVKNESAVEEVEPTEDPLSRAGAAVLVTAGVVAIGAFGYWLWQDFKSETTQHNGLDLLGTVD
jgi:hypothetical protein